MGRSRGAPDLQCAKAGGDARSTTRGLAASSQKSAERVRADGWCYVVARRSFARSTPRRNSPNPIPHHPGGRRRSLGCSLGGHVAIPRTTTNRDAGRRLRILSPNRSVKRPQFSRRNIDPPCVAKPRVGNRQVEPHANVFHCFAQREQRAKRSRFNQHSIPIQMVAASLEDADRIGDPKKLSCGIILKSSTTDASFHE